MHARKIAGIASLVCAVGCKSPSTPLVERPTDHSAAPPALHYDLILKRGRVVDGTGAASRVADVAVKGGKIAAIGDVVGDAPLIVDAEGLVVAPGFIDVHSHGENILKIPSADNYVHMGVTTIIIGNCGKSNVDLTDFFSQMTTTKVAINVGSLMGLGAIRQRAMGGNFKRTPAPEELDSMKEIVEKGMNDGAFGLSTGLIYVPDRWAGKDEILSLARIAAAHHGIYASHIRSEGVNVFRAAEELLHVGEETKMRIEYSHIKISFQPNFGKGPDLLGMLDKARSGGEDVATDIYLYPIASNAMVNQVPPDAQEGGHAKLVERLEDPTTRNAYAGVMRKGLELADHQDYSYMYLARYAKDRSLEGKNIPEIAKKLYGNDSLDHQIDAILDIAKDPQALGNYDLESAGDLERFVADPHTMIAADTAVVQVGAEEPNPRQVGNNARMLEHYVRELKVFTMEEAVRKMTSLPAETFGIQGRGRIAQGYAADLVVFDPEKIHTASTLEDPNHYPVGFRRVFVNGVEVLRDDEELAARPGEAVRFDGKTKAAP